jgi:Flp pilus assembly protein TadG
MFPGKISLWRKFRGFLRNRRGNMGLLFAGGLTTLVGVGAIAVDANHLYTMQNRLRFTADSAALAAAAQLPDVSAAEAAAIDFAGRNMDPARHGSVVAASDVVAGNWVSSSRTFTPGGSPINAIQVTTRRSQANGNPTATYFAKAMGFGDVDLSAQAVAGAGPGSACILALNPSASSALHVQGTAFVRAVDCNIQVNSCHSSQALYAQGNVDLIVDIVTLGATGEIKVCGAAKLQGPANVTPAAKEGEDPLADPYAAVPGPSVGGCDHTNFSATGSVTLNPGVYCGGISLAGNGTATFLGTGDGIYVIKDGELSVTGNVDVVGDGVGFYLTGAAARVDFGGTADIGLKAPSGGALAGFVLFGDRANPATSAHSMRGTPLGGYNGAIYLPGAALDFHGTANGVVTGGSDCTIVVADTLIFAGTPTLHAESTCTDYPGLLAGGNVALVN